MMFTTIDVPTLKAVKNSVIGNRTAKGSYGRDEIFIARCVSRYVMPVSRAPNAKRHGHRVAGWSTPCTTRPSPPTPQRAPRQTSASRPRTSSPRCPTVRRPSVCPRPCPRPQKRAPRLRRRPQDAPPGGRDAGAPLRHDHLPAVRPGRPQGRGGPRTPRDVRRARGHRRSVSVGSHLVKLGPPPRSQGGPRLPLPGKPAPSFPSHTQVLTRRNPTPSTHTAP